MLIRVLKIFRDFQHAFHTAKNLGDFVQKSNGKVYFGQSNQNIQDHLSRWSPLISWIGQTSICLFILANHFITLLLFSRFHLCGEFGKGKNVKSHSSQLTLLDQKAFLYFPCLVPLFSDRSVWYNGKYPYQHL